MNVAIQWVRQRGRANSTQRTGADDVRGEERARTAEDERHEGAPPPGGCGKATSEGQGLDSKRARDGGSETGERQVGEAACN